LSSSRGRPLTRTGRFLRGVATGYASQILITLVGLWLVRFLLEQLGQQQYGLWLVGLQLLGYIGLLDLGVVALLPRETAWATGRAGGDQSTPELAQLLGRTTRLVLWQTPVVALACLIIWLLFPLQWEPLRIPLGIVLVAFVVTFPTRIFQASLTGLQDLAFLGISGTFAWAVNTGLVVALVLLGYGLNALAIGWAAGRLVSTVFAWARLHRQFPSVLPRRLPREVGATVKQLGRGMWVSLSSVAHVLLNATDILLVGAIMGPAAAVPYAVTAKLVQVLASYPQAAVTTAAPGLSELKTAGTRERILQVSRALAEATMVFSGLLVCIVLAVNQSFVSWWVGREYWGGMPLMILIIARVLAGHLALSLGTGLFSFGHERRLALTALAAGALTVASSAVLIAWLGLIGAPLGALAGLLLVSLPAHLRGLGNETGTSPLRLIAGMWPWLWRLGLVASFSGIVFAPRSQANLLQQAGFAVAVAIAYAVLAVPRLRTGPLAIYLQPRLSSALRRISSPLRRPG
jgi:O-antigen/teichoic acid export membrane protein